MLNSYVLTSTLKDMLRPGRIVPWVLLALVLAGVSWLWLSMSRDPVGLQEYGMLVRLIVYRIVALAAAMFTVVVISQEIEQKTIVYLVTRSVPRATLVFSRGLAAVVSVTIMSWLSLIAVAFVMLGPGFLSQGVFWMDMLIMFLGAAAYSALFVFVTLLINRAMLLILLFAFMWEAFVPYLQGDMYLLTINTYMSVLATHPGKSEGVAAIAALQAGSSGVNVVYAWIILISVAVGFLMLSGWWFSKFQYLPREDAE